MRNRATRAWWHVLYFLGYERLAWPRLWGQRPRVGVGVSYVWMDELIHMLDPDVSAFTALMNKLPQRAGLITTAIEWLDDTFMPSFRPSDLWGEWSWVDCHTPLATSRDLSYSE